MLCLLYPYVFVVVFSEYIRVRILFYSLCVRGPPFLSEMVLYVYLCMYGVDSLSMTTVQPYHAAGEGHWVMCYAAADRPTVQASGRLSNRTISRQCMIMVRACVDSFARSFSLCIFFSCSKFCVPYPLPLIVSFSF